MKNLIKIIVLVIIIIGGFYLLRSMKASKEAAKVASGKSTHNSALSENQNNDATRI